MRLSLIPVGGYLFVVLVAAALVALLWWAPVGDRGTVRRRRVLGILRATSILLLLVAMLRPTVVYTSVKQQSATLVLLLDRSRSMQVADGLGGSTRWSSLWAAVADALPEFDTLGDDLELRAYTIDAEAREVPWEELSDTFSAEEDGSPASSKDKENWAAPEGEETALGYVLEQVMQREAGKRLAGVILMSDGAQRAYAPRDVPPQIAARRLADLGYPLYAFALGSTTSSGERRDIALRDLVATQPIFVKNRLTATATARVEGLVNRDVPVELLFESAPGKMEVVSQKTYRVVEQGEQLHLELDHVPVLPGEFKMILRAVPQPGESLTSNNELATFVNVLKGGVNVLYVEGAIRPEMPYLIRALASSPNIKVDAVRVNAERRETRPPDFAERFKPGKYDVYILGDLDSTAFDDAELTNLADAVRRGAGLIMIGGVHSFGPGGYQKTALADVLPIVMTDLERQNFHEPLSPDLHLSGPPKLRPTKLAEGHFILRLGEAGQSSSVWANLPPLPGGANRFRGLKPGANVLAESEAGDPLLVAQGLERGRVLCFAGDSTWRWALEGFEDEHRRFWRQIVLWLAHKDESSDGEVWVRLDSRRFSRGQRVEFELGARDGQGDRVDDAEFEVEVAAPDGSKQRVRATNSATGERGVFLATSKAGDYTISVAARRGGTSLGTTHARFLVFEEDLELENPVADPTLLATLASISGGKALAAEELPGLIEELQRYPEQLEVEIERRETMWDSWPFFLLFVGLLGTEWFLRKRWGFV
ncbi:MAG: hypothetical protein KF708_02715 [Pirellulales bacterium]|nr:hypothetical protein [Pirellulales bacterium]